jgi:hypothetical protein
MKNGIKELLTNANLIKQCELKRLEIANNTATDNEAKALKLSDTMKLLKQGFLNKNKLIFLDIGTEKFCIYDISGNFIQRIDKNVTLESYVYQNFKVSIAGNTFFRTLPMLETRYTPHEPQIFFKDNNIYFNTFVETEILKTRHFIKPTDRIDNIDFSKYPNIYKLLKNVYPVKEHLDYTLNWYSTIFNTLKKTRTAILLKGVQGAGKGLIEEYLIYYAMGEENCITISNDTLNSRFNEELENVLFVFANEVKGNFHDGNTTFEKIKQWITDPRIVIEGKNIKRRVFKNYFNMVIHSNNDTPLQIQILDRRYTVFITNNQKINDIVTHSNMDNFINNIKKERDDFLKDVIKLKYISSTAELPFDTEDKEQVIEASTPKIELLGYWLRNGDIDRISSEIDLLTTYTDKELSLIFDITEITDIQKENSIKELKENINLAFYHGFINVEITTILYKIFINPTDGTRKIGLALNNVLGKSKLKKYNDTVSRGRNIKKLNLIPF